MIVTVVGNINNPRRMVEKYFSKIREGPTARKESFSEPPENIKQKCAEKRDMLSSYAVMGYKTVNRAEWESYVFDVIRAVVGRGQSGTLFNEVRAKRGLAYDIGVHHEANSDYGFFAVNFSTDKKNIPAIVDIVLKEFSKLKRIPKKDLDEAKTFIEGEFYLDNEDNFRSADNISFWEMIMDAGLAKKYISEIKKVTKKDIAKAAKKFLTKNYTLAVIEQE